MEREEKKIRKRVEKGKKSPKVKKQFSSGTKPKKTSFGSMITSSLGNKGLNTFLTGVFVQPKLNVGRSGDRYELEADKTAKQLLSPNTSSSNKLKISKIYTSGSAGGTKLSNKASSQIKNLTTGGKSLDKTTRDYFEPRFGMDLSNVKIHTGSKAGKVTKDINARALTFGNNIAFGKGEYNPGTASGKKLIAHELTHVVQQSGGMAAETTAKNNQPTYNNLELNRNPGTTSINLNNKTSPGNFNNYSSVKTGPGQTSRVAKAGTGAVGAARNGFASPVKSVQKKSAGGPGRAAVAPSRGKMVQAWFFGNKDEEKKQKEDDKKEEEKKDGGPGGFVMWLFEKALGAIGIDLNALKGLLGKGYDAIGKIISDPGAFLGNLIEAVKGGIQNFVANIKTHLLKGLATWLFGKFAGEGLELPDKLDVKGVFKIVMQLLGLTYDSIRGRVVKGLGKHGEKIVGACEKGFDFLKNIVTNGPMAIFDMIKDSLSNIKQTVISGIMSWIATTVIKKGVAKLMLMLNPAGAIIGIIKTVWDIISFFRSNWDKIVSFARSVIDGVYDIAYGKLGGAMSNIESSLGKLIPITLGFIAKFIGLDGITKKIIDIIKKVKQPIDNALNKAVGFITKKIKGTKIFKTVVKGIDKAEGAKKKVTDKVDQVKDKAKKKADEMEKKLDKKIISSRDARIEKGKKTKESKKKKKAEEQKKRQAEKQRKEKAKREKRKKRDAEKADKRRQKAEKRRKRAEEKARKKKGKAKKEKDKIGKKKGSVNTADKQKYKRYTDSIAKKLSKDTGKNEKTFEKFYAKKAKLADSLETKFVKKAKQGVKVVVGIEPLASAKKSGDINFSIKFGKLAGKKGKVKYLGKGTDVGEKIDVKVPFEMAGEGHTLSVTEVKGELKLLMASTPEELRTKWKREEKIFKNYQVYLKDVPDSIKVPLDKELSQLYNELVVKINGMFKDFDNFDAYYEKIRSKSKSGGGPSEAVIRKSLQGQIAKALNKFTKEMIAIGNKYQIHDITKLDLEQKRIAEHLAPLQAEVEEVILKCKEEIAEAVPPGTKVKYRGSLASGFRSFKGDTLADAAELIKPDHFDADAYLEITKEEFEKILEDNPQLRELKKDRLMLSDIDKWEYKEDILFVIELIQDMLKDKEFYKKDAGGTPDFFFVIQTPERSKRQEEQGQEYPAGALEEAGFPESEKASQLRRGTQTIGSDNPALKKDKDHKNLLVGETVRGLEVKPRTVLTVEKKMSLNGEQHTIIIEGDKLDMASRRSALSDKIAGMTHELMKLQKANPGDAALQQQINDLKAIGRKARPVLDKMKTLKGLNKKGKWDQGKGSKISLGKYVGSLATAIEKYAAKYGVKDIDRKEAIDMAKRVSGKSDKANETKEQRELRLAKEAVAKKALYKSANQKMEAVLKKNDKVIKNLKKANAGVKGVYKSENLQALIPLKNKLDELLKIEGISLSKYQRLVTMRIENMPVEDREAMIRIRKAIPDPTKDTLMQKVVDMKTLDNYVTNTWAPKVQGCVAHMSDMVDVKEYLDVRQALRLDYDGTPFTKNGVKEYGVIRFQIDDVQNLDSAFAASIGGNNLNPFPSSGHGKITDIGGVSEYILAASKMTKGAELYKVDTDGNETLYGYFNGKKFVKA